MTKISNKMLIIGLGNPGPKYKKTRHNVGLRVIDELSNEIFDKDIFLFNPQVFMNESGKAVKKIIQNSKFKIQDSIIIHDDIDLPLGTIRISRNVSSAGHKGIQSIINELRSQDFTRIRIGIQPKIGKTQNTERFVLKNFTKEEERIVKKVIEKIIEIFKIDLRGKIEPITIKVN